MPGVNMPDREELAEALTHASRADARDWQWIDGLLDMWLETV